MSAQDKSGSHVECSDCGRAACCYEKDSSPRRYYCGRHGARWAKCGVYIIQDPRLARAKPASDPAAVAEPDYVAQLCDALREAGAVPYINTAYLSERGRVIAFRKRAAAWLTGRRAPFRHWEK